MVLGLDFGGSKIAAALCGLDGRRRSERTVATDPSLGARPNLERAIEAGLALLDEAGPSVVVAAVGACTFGIPRENGVELSPAIEGWDSLPLRRELAGAFGVPVTVLTDVKAAAGAEARHGALVGADPGLYLNLGTGLAAAIVLNGNVVSGAHGASGEIGYDLRAAEDVWAATVHDGPVLEGLVSGMGLWSAVSRLSGDPDTDRRTGASEAFERATSDPAYRELLSGFLRELSYHLVNLAIAIDPERIVVGGGMVHSWDVLEAPMRSALDAHVPYPPQLVRGAFPFDAPLRGALEAGIDLVRRADGTSADGARQNARWTEGDGGRDGADSNQSSAAATMEVTGPNIR